MILDEVLTIVVIVDFTRNLNTFGCLDVDLEDIATRFTVLVLVVTGLNNELNGLANSLFLEDTRSESKGLVGTGVKEVSVADRGCR